MNISYHKLINDTSDYEHAKTLFTEYANSMEHYMCFESLAEELKEIEIHYGAPNGGILLLYVNDEVAGCAGIQKWEEGTAELKRMYIRPDYRGKGRGRRLLNAAIAFAKKMDFKTVQLDTIPDMMPAAIKLYEDVGFEKRTIEASEEVGEGVEYYSLAI